MRFFIFLISVFCISLQAEDQIVSFDRPLKPGTHFDCSIVTEQSARYTFKLQGNPDPVIRYENVTASFGGYLTILKVNTAGNPTLMRIRINALTASLNGKKVSFSCIGKTILAELSTPASVFTGTDHQKLSDAESAVLSALFHPALDNKLSDSTGATHVLPKQGQGWPLKTDRFLQTLQKRNIHLPPKSIQTGITYQGEKYNRQERCRKFTMMMETLRTNDYDFRLKATFLLAPDGPLRTLSREAVEIVHRKLSSTHPFAAGAVVELRSQDRTEQQMYPLKELPEEQFQRKKAPWESLLQ